MARTKKLEEKDHPKIFKCKDGTYRIRTDKHIAPNLEAMYKRIKER